MKNHILYNTLMRILLPFVLLNLKRKAKKQPEYGFRWDERLANCPIKVRPKGILIHVASLGEALSAAPIIQDLIAHYPNEAITVTSTTPTGSAQIQQLFSTHVTHCYLPYDLPILQYRFINLIKPRLLVLMETELWPNLISNAKRVGASVVVINARLSERSYKGYARFRSVSATMINQIDLISTQYYTDAQRFIDLGAKRSQIKTTGNIKFDCELSDDQALKNQQLKNQWQLNKPVVVAASTHEGEEAIILAAFKILKTNIPNLVLIIVPRHPERFDSVFQLCSPHFNTVYKTQITESVPINTDIIIGNTLGEMLQYMSLAQVVIMGGSLVERGGHNPFEAICQQKAVITGPHIFNFKASYQILKSREGALEVEDKQQLIDNLYTLLMSEAECNTIAQNGYRCLKEFQGSSQKTTQLLIEQFDKTVPVNVYNVVKKISHAKT
ncbi:lipid IV(A) 3-deoxy-D-manno-octulosonic acid transferase [Algibacillus agarilyticus]|uniref:lipid IV(A) 3-deoxy-D-manno-octulosonic acid transferase n=1 Tax=Algibacillus agarilyticus TaxID=2234133 RepID=UPI000DD014C1|nr:lipid IV(A) 3-deoxy-D-manno-octulosonic acid transferase [Algibacillus agarilyticus]